MLEKSVVIADMAKYTWSLRYNNARNYYIIGAGGNQSAGEALDVSMGYLIGSQVSYAAGQAIKGASNQLNKIKGTLNTVNVNADVRKFSEYIFKDGAAPGKDVVYKNMGYGVQDSQL